MDWIIGIQRAIDYIEDHLTEEIDYEKVAAESFSSSYHFQRVFSILCGFTLGEYIRSRRLTLAGAELAKGHGKVIDVALKYGYENPDSFAKAFQKFHGITPSAAKTNGQNLRSFSKLVLEISLEGGRDMNYRIEEKKEMILAGYKRHFTGAPYGKAREEQEEQLFVSTRAKQWMLRGAKSLKDTYTDICVITNVDDEGYDFYYAAELDQYTRDDLYNTAVTGFEYMKEFGFETIEVPAHTYAVFSTNTQRFLTTEDEKMGEDKSPVVRYLKIREQIMTEWLKSSDWQISNAPEIAVYHWLPEKEKRYIEIWLPIEKSK